MSTAGTPAAMSLDELSLLDPLSLLGPAAHGDVDAFRKLALLCWASGVSNCDGERCLTYAYGDPHLLVETSLMFSRLAAARGRESDIIALSNRLNLAATIEGLEDERKAESIAWIEREADAGSGMATLALNRIAAEASPCALAWARDFSVRLKRYIPRTPAGDDTSEFRPGDDYKRADSSARYAPAPGQVAWLAAPTGRTI